MKALHNDTDGTTKGKILANSSANPANPVRPVRRAFNLKLPNHARVIRTFLSTALLILVSMLLHGCSSNRSSTDKYSLVPSAGGSPPTGNTNSPATEISTARAEPLPAPVNNPSRPALAFPTGWQNLFDGSSLKGWKVTEFGGHGEVGVEDSQIVIHLGAMLTGVCWTNEFPKSDYEVELEARKIEGGDFFAGITFPVGESFCSFIVGGWGGGVVGLSSIDGMDASENETTKYMSFPKDRWFRLKLRVTHDKIATWIDDEQMADVALAGRRISLRSGEIYLSQPFGIATWQTTGALRNLRLRLLGDASAKPAQ